MEKVGFLSFLPGRLFACMIIVSTLAAPAGANYSGGSGSAEDPYQIADVNDFLDLSATPTDWDKHFILVADLDLSDYAFTQAPIAPDESPDWPYQGTQFTGVFNGEGHTIYNLTITAPQSDYIGLFGDIGADGHVKNLGLINADIQGRQYVGVLCGWNYGTINECYAAGSITGYAFVGGLCGRNSGTISGSYVTGAVSGRRTAGGLCGWNNGTISHSYAMVMVLSEQGIAGGLCGGNAGTISDSYATGTICSPGKDIGGLVGNNGGEVINAYATGSVTGDEMVGGLVGSNTGPLTFCYASGLVNGNSFIGGLTGFNARGGACFASVWDVQTTGLTAGIGNVDPDPEGAQGKTTAEMQSLATFTAVAWDFSETWAICEGTNYPRLRWQILAADFLCPDGVDFRDFAHLASWWAADDCELNDNCDGADLNADGSVDFRDLLILTGHWLEGI